MQYITIKGAREHNLKNIDVSIPRDQFVVITGLSGSGKSSLAFDTIYAEGQRRFMESLSAYARQFLGMMERPDVDFIDGLSPVISIDQKTTSRNPRSTVGTVTEIYDFMRLLFARIGDPYSYLSGNRMERQTTEQMVESILSLPTGTKAYCLAPVVRGRKGHYRELFEQTQKQGFLRVRVDGEFFDLDKKLQIDRYKTHNIEVVVDRFVISENSRTRIAQSVAMATEMADGNLILAIQEDGKIRDRLFSQKLFDTASGLAYEDPAPNLFSFNSPFGACKTCNGMGYSTDANPEIIIPNTEQSIREGAIRYLGEAKGTFVFKQIEAILEEYQSDFDTPWKNIPEEAQHIILHGSNGRKFKVAYDFKDNSVSYNHSFDGIIALIRDNAINGTAKEKEKAQAYLSKVVCPECHGGRLNQEALSYKIEGYSIYDWVQMDISELRLAIGKLHLTERQQRIGHQVLKEIRDRLDFLNNVGLNYLSLGREAQTLSGGEAQRIRLATQIGTQLVGVLYILDEPSIGLHQRDNIKLIRSLETLRDLGNSVIVVEHDRETISHADFVVDMGLGAGIYGGNIVSQGKPDELASDSLTAKYLKDELQIAVPEKHRKGTGKSILIKGASGNNLKNVDLEIPLGKFICITGVSGSGKSSLINQTLVPILSSYCYHSKTPALPYQSVQGLEHIDKIISVDQSPIGRTPRSNPGTYTKLFDHIRNLFAELPESKIRGYDRGRFSFNVKGGRCETCGGDGLRKIEMNFLPDVYVPCETCKGKRYNRETLQIYYKGKNISDVLDMHIAEALPFFDAVPPIRRILETLHSVGLGYLSIGQSSTTLSGGEAQRIKLSRELSKIGTGDTVYILDEPTTGLHFEDVKILVDVLNKLTDKGNTVIVIEHNLDLIKASDWVIDLGPEGGRFGGEIIATGSPQEVAQNFDTPTAQFLKKELERVREAAKSVL